MDASYDGPRNEGMAKVLLSQDMKRCLLAVAQEAAEGFKVLAPRRTGRMAGSAKASTKWSDLGPRDRWMGVVTVDARDPKNNKKYAVWNQTGAGDYQHPRSRDQQPKYGAYRGAFTFTDVVELMGVT